MVFSCIRQVVSFFPVFNVEGEVVPDLYIVLVLIVGGGGVGRGRVLLFFSVALDGEY